MAEEKAEKLSTYICFSPFPPSRYRIIALVSVIEKNHQGIHMKMKYLVDPKTDNFVKYYLDNPNFYIVVCVVLIFQD
jgi:Tctex-1 family